MLVLGKRKNCRKSESCLIKVERSGTKAAEENEYSEFDFSSLASTRSELGDWLDFYVRRRFAAEDESKRLKYREMLLPENREQDHTEGPFSFFKAGTPKNVRKAKPTFYSRWGIVILTITMLFVPFAFFGAGKAVQSNVNKVEDWLPKTFAETAELEWFRANFPTDQFVIVSWEGCRLGTDPSLPNAEPDDPRIAQLASILQPPPDAIETEDTRDARMFVKSVMTGREMLDQLTSPPSSIPYEMAVHRLTGSLIGPDKHRPAWWSA